jgi:CCR4-NOT transcription complex subunit 1
VFFKGVLKVLLVIVHDWQDFLAEYAILLCDEIPDKFIQLRNIVLAAFPSGNQYPDPTGGTQLESFADKFTDMPRFQEQIY